MKRFITGLLTWTVILVLLTGCSQANNPAYKSEESTAAKAESTTLSSKPQISVKPSAGWEEKKGAALAQYMKEAASFIVSYDTIPSEVKDSEGYVEFAKAQFIKVFPDASFTETKKIMVDGIEGQELGFTASASGMKMKYRIVYLLKGQLAYTLTCGAFQEDFEAVMQDFQAMIESFKIL